MVIASMGRKLGLFAAACALGLGLATGAAAQQALAVELYPDADGATAEIVASAEGALTNTEGISYDVDGDGVAENIRLGYGTIEGATINAALCIDNVEKVQGLPDEMEEDSLKLELIKLPDGCLLLHAYGYCNESIGDGLDRLFKVEVGSDPSDPEFAHNVKLVIDCYNNPYLVEGKGITNGGCTLDLIIGNSIYLSASCTTRVAGTITYYIDYKCSKAGKVTRYLYNPSMAFSNFYKNGERCYYSPTLRDVKVYTGIKCKKYTTIKKGTQMYVSGIYDKGGTKLLQVRTKPKGSSKSVVSGYIKINTKPLFKYAQVDVAG